MLLAEVVGVGEEPNANLSSGAWVIGAWVSRDMMTLLHDCLRQKLSEVPESDDRDLQPHPRPDFLRVIGGNCAGWGIIPCETARLWAGVSAAVDLGYAGRAADEQRLGVAIGSDREVWFWGRKKAALVRLGGSGGVEGSSGDGGGDRKHGSLRWRLKMAVPSEWMQGKGGGFYRQNVTRALGENITKWHVVPTTSLGFWAKEI